MMQTKSLEDLLPEWSDKNIRPLSDYTQKSVHCGMWICPKGHEYSMPIYKRTEGHGCPYCSGRRVITGETDLQTKHPDVAKYWDYDKNYPLTPQDVSTGSGQKVWWKCEHGHSWQRPIFRQCHVTQPCPYCDNRWLSPSYNLATRFPDLAKEWDYEKNTCKPEEFLPFEKKVVWWKCSQLHSWSASIEERTRHGKGCPCCTRIKDAAKLNTLISNQTLMAEWSPQNDKPLGEYTQHTSHKGIWICPTGHAYTMAIKDRLKGRGCPYCHGHSVLKGETDLNTKRPDVAAYWDYDKNGGLTPQDVFPGSSTVAVWWKCEHGHSWKNTVKNQCNRKIACPYCSHTLPSKEYNLATEFPDIVKEWDYDKNATKPEEYLPFSGQVVWWKCANQHSWSTEISTRTHKHERCPYCAGFYAIKGKTDLFTINPELALEWDFERNVENPEELTAYSRRKVWWICPHGHHYRSMIASRSLGKGCLECYKNRAIYNKNKDA